MKIPTPYAYNPFDPDGFATNWATSPNGTQVRLGNRAAAPRSLAHLVNRCLSRFPRPMFTQAWPSAYMDTTGSDPLIVWTLLDNVNNARNNTIKILALPRTSGSGDSYAERSGGSASEQTPKIAQAVYASATLDDLFEDEYPVARGADANAEIEEGMSTYNGYTVVGVVVQDDEIDELDTTNHVYCSPHLAKQGDKVLADTLEECRAGLHEIRTTNLPIWGWSALFSGGSPATPSVTDQTGIRVQSTSYVNVLDQTVSSRTANSPGSVHQVQYAGIGNYAETTGKRIKLMVRIYAEVDGGASAGEFQIVGPDHLASNTTTISVTAGAGAAWYGTSSNYIYLNGQSGPSDTTTARNKVDFLARLSTGAVNNLYIYAISRWIEVS